MKTINEIVGIDLGTTNSVVSILKEKTPQTVLIDDSKLLPSVVSLTKDGFIVGQVAKNLALLEPEKTIASIKRKMGEDIQLSIGDRSMRPEEIAALILKKIKQSVATQLACAQEEQIKTVVTVPAYFTEEQRAATKEAAELAGFKVERIINEPTAAALAFGLSKMDQAIYAVYDFGGGTFDISIIESNEGLIEVLATRGDNNLGGDDLDQLVADHIWNKFVEKNKLGEISPSKKEKARLMRIAERSKINLSKEVLVDIQESFFLQKDGNNYHLEQKLSREEFENLILSKVEATIEHLELAVEDSKLQLNELDGILLVGGSSKIPMIAKLIEEKLGISPILMDFPDEAVSHGATIQGAIINKIDLDTVLIDITPHSLGVGVLDEQSFHSTILMQSGEEKKNLDLAAVPIITKNTPIPTKKSKKFSAIVPFQKEFEVKIFQGEQRRFVDNKLIGKILLEVEDPVEDGEVEVFFEIDINGLLKVTAVEINTKEKVNAKFQSVRGMKIQKSKLDEMAVLSMDQTDNTLLKRAEKLLAEKQIGEEDQNELKEIIEKFKAIQIAGEDSQSIEEELLDLLYYLEGNEN